MKRRFSPLAAAAILLLGALFAWILFESRRSGGGTPPSSSGAPVGASYKRIDAHAHLDVGSLGYLRELMDRYGFDHIVDLSGGSPDPPPPLARHSLSLHLAQAQASGGRITVFMTIPGWEMQTPGFGERIAAMVEKAHQMGARGLKIPKGLGLGYVDSDERLIPVDDPRLDPVFEACGRLSMPVSIHTADPKAFWQPPDRNNERYEELSVHPRWSFYGFPLSWEELLAQLERRIARHPKTNFIAVHFGNAAEEPDRVARMLRTYPNLYIDTAARIPEFGRHPPAKMRQFFIEFQDRILYGTDLGVGTDPYDIMLGSTGADPPNASDIDRFFRSSYRYFESSDLSFESPTPIQGKWSISAIHLPREVLEKVYFRNAHKVIGIPIPQ
jgi:predicted TIM-barrel fold metal-dependent hydrolase